MVDVGAVRIVSAKLFVGGSLLAPKSSVLIGLGAEVAVKGSLRASGITAAEAERLQQIPNRRNDISSSFETGAKQGSWTKQVKQGIKAETEVQVGEQIESSEMLNSRPIGDQKATGNKSDNSDNKNGTNQEGRAETNSSAVFRPRPAIFVESSELVVEGLLECVNSWIDITRRSKVVVGAGVMSHQTNSTLIRVRLSSTLTVTKGSLVSGVSLLVAESSRLHVPNGNILSNGLIEIRDRSSINSKSVSAKSDVWISGRSLVAVDKGCVIGGALLSVSENSVMRCGGENCN